VRLRKVETEDFETDVLQAVRLMETEQESQAKEDLREF
jgi:hypothetical protein